MVNLGRWKRSVQIFYAIPSMPLSAPAELRTSVLYSLHKALCCTQQHPIDHTVLKHPRCPTLSGTLEEHIGKAKSSMSLLPSVQIHIPLHQGLMIAMNSKS